MRKVLLATTALVAFAATAQAAESPIAINVGGYVDFRAALFSPNDSNAAGNNGAVKARHGDFETEYRINMAAEGKAAHGIEYGAMVSLWNGRGYNSDAEGISNSIHEDQAYVWMSGAWGKVIMGDEHGASDLYTYAPTVGEGQIDGSYTNFTDHSQLMVMHPAYFDATENATKFTYYTPKVGNANHKVQLGASFTPNFTEQGEQTALYRVSNSTPAYKNATEETIRYTGSYGSVGAVVAGIMATGEAEKDTFALNSLTGRDYFGWGFGSQLTYAGFTLGGGYTNAGHLGTVQGQSKEQDVWTLGLKYEMDKIAVAVNGLQGRGYNSAAAFTSKSAAAAGSYSDGYVRDYRAMGFGATYTWFPGMTTAADVVVYDQKRDDMPTDKIAGNVLMLSQKLAF